MSSDSLSSNSIVLFFFWRKLASLLMLSSTRKNRICPGRFLADVSLWLSMATILATLDLGKAKDKDGKEIDFVPKPKVIFAQYVNFSRFLFHGSDHCLGMQAIRAVPDGD